MVGDIESAIRELGIDYRLSGDEATARCPSHSDRNPSWSVNTRTGVHHCFSCGFSGNLASLVALLLNLSYQDAVLWCNERIGWSAAHQWREDKEVKNFSPAYLKVSEMDTALFTKVPAEYLKSKRITEEAADKFGILWNPKNKTWIFPVRDPFTGQLWGWQSKNDRTFRHYPQGIPRSETLFGVGAFPNGGTAVLVESPIDCAYLCSAGISGGLASFGVQVSSRQFSLVQYFANSLVLALDNDMPGVDQTARACERDDGIRVFNYAVNPDVKDLGEMTYEEVRQGAEYSLSSLKFLKVIKDNKVLRQALNVYRDTRRLPETRKGQVLKPWQLIGGLQYGTG